MIRAVGVLDCFRAHIRLRELGKSEDKVEGKSSTESLIPCSYGGRMLGRKNVYLAGTVMLIFGMGLYGLFISNVPPGIPSGVDRALKGSSLFGMFALKHVPNANSHAAAKQGETIIRSHFFFMQERPKWMQISSLDELKTKVGHVIVMILLVKMFERSKMVNIATGQDLLSYSICIFLSSASLYILHNLHKPE
ncbi:hypothetical protein BHM03_00021153 [Ensete ventricosum]|nr:hypothetical protein BHM03_00021153 [Ensete ventricosum]